MKFPIRKSSGEREQFSLKKIRRSLSRAGASNKEITQVIHEIKKKRPKSTQEVHTIALRILKKENLPIADRYNLKRGIMQLGPEGYPFEKYIGELFRALGYTVQTNQEIPGICVMHEVDCVAQKDTKQYMIETKFHNRMGIKSDVKVALYVYARFQDIADYQASHHATNPYSQAWLITNTKLTSQAIQYGRCKNMNLLSWNYPESNSLAQLVEQYNLVPITTLTGLNKKQKRECIKNGLVMCKDVGKRKNILSKIGLSEHKVKKVIAESQAVCST